ncbi:metal-dependent hydrolase [Microbispora rosea]|uniref:metal-dependent hydrolase n=1 Tax=Microbispora rosea TaxID=58117 RepID=UPI00379AC07A
MMGTQHALSGALAWSCVVAIHPPATPVLVAGYAVTAAAAIWPDLDHPGSTVTRSLGPLTWLMCQVVQAVSGGHRRGTHSLAGCATLGAVCAIAVQARPAIWASVVLTVLLAVMLASLAHLVPLRSWRKGWLDEFVAVGVAVGIAWWPGLDLGALAPAVFLGTLVHALGDAITVQGIPFFWPLSRQNFRLARLRAGGPTERWFIRPALVLAIPVVPLWDPIWASLGH